MAIKSARGELPGWMRTKTADRGRQSWWRPATWVFLIAFALQSYVAQTHIHGLIQDGAGIAKALGERSHGKLSDENGATDCPFCQAVLHAGAFYTPVSPSVLPPAIWAELARPLVATIVAGTRVAPHWQSRAPPQH